MLHNTKRQGVNKALPAVQTDPTGAQVPFAPNAPKRFVIGGRDRNIYLLENDRLICLTRDGVVQKPVIVRFPDCRAAG